MDTESAPQNSTAKINRDYVLSDEAIELAIENLFSDKKSLRKFIGRYSNAINKAYFQSEVDHVHLKFGRQLIGLMRLRTRSPRSYSDLVRDRKSKVFVQKFLKGTA